MRGLLLHCLVPTPANTSCNNANPVEIRCESGSAVETCDRNGVRPSRLETSESYEMRFHHILIPIISSDREENRLTSAAIDADAGASRIRSSLSKSVVDVAVEIVKADILSSCWRRLAGYLRPNVVEAYPDLS